MKEPTKQHTGDGQDNYGQAAKQIGAAAKTAGKETAEQAVQKGAEATVNAAANTMKVSAKTGKAVSEIAAGAATGGPWGAIISAAWSMRHTLFKVLVSICLAVVFLVILIISLPSIIFDSIFGLSEDYSGSSLTAAYAQLETSVHSTVAEGYRYALNKVDGIIADGGYNYELSKKATEDRSGGQADYDVCYVLAAYSASMNQTGASADNMTSKMRSVIDEMFRVSYEILHVEIPIFSDLMEIIGTEIVSYARCVIHPFDNRFFLRAFDIDLDAKYGEFDITYGQAIDYMSETLRLTLSDLAGG